MKLTQYIVISLLATAQWLTVFSMQQPRTLERQLLTLKKALSSPKLRQLNQAREILRCNRGLATQCFRSRPLVHAAQTAAAVNLLQLFGADFKSTDRFSNSALHNAQTSDTTLALLAAGMNVNQINTEDQTALFFAHSARQVELLVQLGANVNAVDKFGRTPLYYARTGAIAKALLKAGAWLNVEDKNGRSPAQVLSRTNIEAAREIEFFLKQQQEKKEAKLQQHVLKHRPAMVWRAVEHKVPTIEYKETEQQEPENSELLAASLMVEKLEAEAQQEEAKIIEQQTIQNSTPIIIPGPTENTVEHKELRATETVKSVDTNPLSNFVQDNPYAVLHDDKDDTTPDLILVGDAPATQPVGQQTIVNQTPVLARFEQPNRFAALLVDDDTLDIQQTKTNNNQPKKKHKKSVAFAAPISTSQPVQTTSMPSSSSTSETTPALEEEHIEYVPQVRTTVRHIAPVVIPNSTPINIPQLTTITIEHKEPAVTAPIAIQATLATQTAETPQTQVPVNSTVHAPAMSPFTLLDTDTETPDLTFELVNAADCTM